MGRYIFTVSIQLHEGFFVAGGAVACVDKGVPAETPKTFEDEIPDAVKRGNRISEHIKLEASSIHTRGPPMMRGARGVPMLPKEMLG